MEITKLPLIKPKLNRKRVVAYTRVSYDSEILLHSLANQVSYYTEHINQNPEWEFCGIYIDEGITGTSIKQRTDFLRMMSDAEMGKFDIVLSKSISRFARNTVDLLESVRRLKEFNVEVRFERENINTFSSDGELMLSLLASFAQAESESISENVSWARKKDMEQGIYYHFTRCFGYRWEGDIYAIVEEEAEVVRYIFESYLKGMSPQRIAKSITVKTVTGCDFTRGTVKDILKNRIYCGDRLMGKAYSPRVRHKIRNYGEMPQYLIENTHEAIITRECFMKTQELMQEKADATPPKTFTCFTGLVKCGYCGRSCLRRVQHGNKIWKCSGNEVSKKCSGRHIKEEDLRKLAFSYLNDEEELKRKIEKILLYDDKVFFRHKDGKEKIFERTIGRRRSSCKRKVK